MARMVNILGGERSDIYTLVANEIIRVLRESGKPLRFQVDRGIIKALVMLTPYNISAIGFADKVLEKVTGSKFKELKRGGTTKSKTIRLTMTNIGSFKVSRNDGVIFWGEKLAVLESKKAGFDFVTRQEVKAIALEIFSIFGVLLPKIGEFKEVLAGFAEGSLKDESKAGGVGFYQPGRLRWMTPAGMVIDQTYMEESGAEMRVPTP